MQIIGFNIIIRKGKVNRELIDGSRQTYLGFTTYNLPANHCSEYIHLKHLYIYICISLLISILKFSSVAIRPCYSKCGPPTSSPSSFRKAESQAPPKPPDFRVCILTTTPDDSYAQQGVRSSACLHKLLSKVNISRLF